MCNCGKPRVAIRVARVKATSTVVSREPVKILSYTPRQPNSGNGVRTGRISRV